MKLQGLPSMQIHTTSDVVLLSCESECYDATGLSWRAPETILRGHVSIHLPRAKTIKSIQVELAGYQSVLIDGLQSCYGLRAATAILQSNIKAYSPGTYSLPFELLVPSDAAPSEKCSFGKTVYKLVATAAGLGPLGTSLSSERPVTIVATHNDPGGLPPGFDLTTSAHSDNLGIVHATLTSPYLLVSGLLNLDIQMPKLQRDVRLVDVRVEIHQRYDLRALDEKWKCQSKKADPIPIWSLRDEQELGIVKAGTGRSFTRQVRLPSEDLLRPTTPEGSLTGIRISHRLSVIVVYLPFLDNPKRLKKEFKIGATAIISSCRCTLNALQLPAYEKHEKINSGRHAHCLCTMSDSERLTFYGESMEDKIVDSSGNSAILSKILREVS